MPLLYVGVRLVRKRGRWLLRKGREEKHSLWPWSLPVSHLGSDHKLLKMWKSSFMKKILSKTGDLSAFKGTFSAE